MKIGDCCSRSVAKVTPGTSLREASLLMRNRHVGALVVVEIEHGLERPVGIVTDRDIVVAVVAPGARLEGISVRDVMPSTLIVARDSDGPFEAFRKMADHGVRRLPVVAADGSLAGIVTADDLLRVVAAELASFATALRRGGERESAERREMK
jgi:CBS domain-containing protein